MSARSLEHDAFLEQIAKEVNGYLPSAEVDRYARQLSVRAVLGPEGIGRTTLMAAAANSTAIATANTSRELRSSDFNYRYRYDFSQPRDRDAVLDGLRRGRFLQVFRDSITGDICTTEPGDFAHDKINLQETTLWEYKRMQQRRFFGPDMGVCVVTRSFQQWQQQWFDREGGRPQHYEARIGEAVDCLSYCLSDERMDFVINTGISESAPQALINGAQSNAYREEGRMAAIRIMQEAGIVINGRVGEGAFRWS